MCEYVIHLRYVLGGAYDNTGCSIFSSLIDYIAVSGSMERNVLEFVDHLHEHFVTPCSINSAGRYNVPTNPKEGYRFVAAIFCQCIVENNNRRRTSIEMHKTSIAEYEWPNGSYWVGARKNKAWSLIRSIMMSEGPVIIILSIFILFVAIDF